MKKGTGKGNANVVTLYKEDTSMSSSSCSGVESEDNDSSVGKKEEACGGNIVIHMFACRSRLAATSCRFQGQD